MARPQGTKVAARHLEQILFVHGLVHVPTWLRERLQPGDVPAQMGADRRYKVRRALAHTLLAERAAP